jgi:hypothetical protein
MPDRIAMPSVPFHHVREEMLLLLKSRDLPQPRIVKVIGFEASLSRDVPFGTRRAADMLGDCNKTDSLVIWDSQEVIFRL